jgi:hypothetical protein
MGTQVPPELKGNLETVTETPLFVVLDKVTVLQHHELDAITDTITQEVNSLDILRATVMNPRHINHLDSLLQMHQVAELRVRGWTGRRSL